MACLKSGKNGAIAAYKSGLGPAGMRTVFIKQIAGGNMFHIPVLRECSGDRAMTRISDARFAVHFFAPNASVNSPLHC